MKTNKTQIPTLLLAVILNAAPVALRTAQVLPSNSPMAIVFKWVIGTLAVAGSYHTVSAATATLVSASTISGSTTARLSYQIKINDGQNRSAESWIVAGTRLTAKGTTTLGLPPGLTMALNTGIISGTPTQGGTFKTTITAYEHPNQSGGKVTFTLTFNITQPLTAPTITTSPVGGTVNEGGSFTFTVAATGTEPLQFLWKRDTTTLSAATSSTLALNPVQLSDAGSYTVTVSNAAGSATSTPVTLAVKALAVGPSITSQPAGVSLHPGETITLSVGATGTGPLAYLWKHNGAAIAGATSPTLAIASASASDAGEYTVEVSNSVSATPSNPATVTLVPLRIAVATAQGTNLSLSLSTIAGRIYLIEETDSISGGTWTLIGEGAAPSETITFSPNPSSQSTRFWRYRTKP